MASLRSLLFNEGDENAALNDAVSYAKGVDRSKAKTEAAEAMKSSMLGQLLHAAYGAATLPGDVYSGKTDPASLEAIGRSSELAGLLGLSSFPLGSRAAKQAANEGKVLLGTFAGPRAKTADHAALKAAKELAEAGASKDEIWGKTGWFQGADKKWRFEIDDSASRFNVSAADAKMPSRFDLAKEYFDQQGIPRGKFATGQMPDVDKAALAYADDMIAKARIGADTQPLPVVFSHGDLYRAYPEVAEYKAARETYGNFGGSFYNGRITYGNQPLGSNIDNRSIILHEGMHGVQGIEGFARGGNPKNVWYALGKEADRLADTPANAKAFAAEQLGLAASYVDLERKLAKNPEYIRKTGDWFEFAPFNAGKKGTSEYEQTIRDVGKKALDARRLKIVHPEFINQVREDPRKLQSIFRANERDWSRYGPVRREMENLRDLSASARSNPQAAQDAYRRLAGEVEARNVQKRMDMTPDQRRATPPWATQDVPDDMQLLRGILGLE
jgi:hypothetical protein